jgi:type I restriction enzyme S subunit
MRVHLFARFLNSIEGQASSTRLGDHYQPVKGLSYHGDGLVSPGKLMVGLGTFSANGGLDLRQLKSYTGGFDNRHLVWPGDVVVANTDITQKRDVLGSVGQVPEWAADGWLYTHHVFALRPTPSCELLPSVLLGLLSMPRFRARVRGFATGTTVLALPKDAITSLEFELPSVDAQRRFDERVEPLRHRSDLAFREGQSLSRLRNLLRPRLISGQIRALGLTTPIGAALTSRMRRYGAS